MEYIAMGVPSGLRAESMITAQADAIVVLPRQSRGAIVQCTLEANLETKRSRWKMVEMRRTGSGRRKSRTGPPVAAAVNEHGQRVNNAKHLALNAEVAGTAGHDER